MVQISDWMNQFVKTVTKEFGSKIVFIGLQGSYGRGEQKESSDIDAVVIFEGFTQEELLRYGQLLEEMPHREKICGFVSGKEELLAWDRGDLFQFYFDTTPYLGSLEDLIPKPTRVDAANAAHMGACNLYHTCVHNLLHEKSDEFLKEAKKALGFVLRAYLYYERGEYQKKSGDLLSAVAGRERELLRSLERDDFYACSLALIAWTKRVIKELAAEKKSE